MSQTEPWRLLHATVFTDGGMLHTWIHLPWRYPTLETQLKALWLIRLELTLAYVGTGIPFILLQRLGRLREPMISSLNPEFVYSRNSARSFLFNSDALLCPV